MSKLSLIFFIVLGACNFSTKEDSGLVITDPTPTGFALVDPSANTYIENDIFSFSITYPQAVTVSGGIPRIALNIGGVSRYATYFSGSTSTTLLFRYTIQNADEDLDGIEFDDEVDFNGATLTFNGDNTPGNALEITDTSDVFVDAVVPVINSVASQPSDDTYYEDGLLRFTLEFSEDVIVTGIPQIPLNIGGATVYADYISGSGSDSLVFSYSVLITDEDDNGIVMSSPVELNTGSIQDSAGNNAILSYTPPNTSGILVDGPTPYITAVNLPADGTYNLGDSIFIQITTSQAVNVTSFPALNLGVGILFSNAIYISGSGTNTLTFRYIVGLGHYDDDGIVIPSTITYGMGESIQNGSGVDLLNEVPVVDSSGILIDATGPDIISVTPPADAIYSVGDQLDFVIEYDASVDVTDTPSISITLNSGTVTATYQSGTGTTELTFRHTVQVGNEDNDGIVLATSIDLNTGTIKDGDGNSASLDFSGLTPIDTSGIIIDGVAPYITNITPPANATYYEGDTLTFSVVFNENVTIGGIPQLNIDVGGSTIQADYQSGTGSNTLVFSYEVLESDVDSDGIELASPLGLNSGSIQDSVSLNAILTFSPPDTSAVLVRGDIPSVLSIASPSDNTYIEGEILSYTFTFSQVVNVVGIPSVNLAIGSNTRTLNYQSGSGSDTLLFSYTVVSGDYDNDGVTPASSFSYDGGESIRSTTAADAVNSFTPPVTPNVLVDAIGPQILSLNAPADKTYAIGENIDLVVNYDETVNMTGAGTPYINLTLESGSVIAQYLSGSGTSSLTFRYTVQTNDNDSNGIVYASTVNLDGNTLKGADLNDADLDFSDLAPLDTSSVLIDGVLPYITSITPPTNATYIIGESLDFVVNFNEAVDYNATIELSITIGASAKTASYVSGSGTNALIFRYTVLAGDEDTNGISVSSPLLGAGSINDLAGNEITYTFTPPNTTGVLVDGIVPYIQSVSAASSDNYAFGENIDYTLTWSEPVNKTGSPRININIGGVSKNLSYLSGAGTASWKFRYTVEASLLDQDGITLSSPLDLNAGTIADLAGNNASPLTYTLPDSSGVLVDSTGPEILSVAASANDMYLENENIDFTVTWDENVTVGGSPRIPINVGGVTRYATYHSGSGTTSHVFRYSVSGLSASGDEDHDGITLSSVVDLNSGSLQDNNVNNAVLSFIAPNTSSIYVDAKNPNVSLVTPANDGFYDESVANRNITFTVQYHENVIVSGSPRLHLSIDGSTQYATYQSGSGSDTLTFTFQLTTPTFDIEGIELANSNNIDLNTGSIVDENSTGHNAALALGGQDLSGVKVVYQGLQVWVDFDDASSVTASCGGGITSVTNKAPGGGALTPSGTAPTYNCTGFGSQSTAYAQFNDSAYFTLPAITSARYFFFALRSHDDAGASASYLGDGYGEFYYYTFIFTQQTRLRFSNSTAYKMNGDALTDFNTNFTGNLWGANTNYVMGLKWQTAANLNDGRIGNDNFNGRIAEVIIFNGNAGNLSDAQMTKISTYLNNKHGLY